MDFQITFDPFLDFMIRMFVIGGAIVVWTIIAIWVIAEVKSWFPKEEEADTDPEEMREYLTEDLHRTQNIYPSKDQAVDDSLNDLGKALERGELTMAEARETFEQWFDTSEPFLIRFPEPGPVSRYPTVIINSTQATPEEGEKVLIDEINHRRH